MVFREIYDKNRYQLESIVRMQVGDTLNELLDYLANTDFYYAPAARLYHDNYPGGLYDHCKSVYSELLNFRTKMNKNWTDLEMFIIAFGHDLCKVGLYTDEIDYNGVITYRYDESHTKDHGTESLRILAGIIPNLINERVANSIVCHMGLWTNDFPNASSFMLDAQTKDDIVFFTHAADMVASRSSRKANLVRYIDNQLIIE